MAAQPNKEVKPAPLKMTGLIFLPIIDASSRVFAFIQVLVFADN